MKGIMDSKALRNSIYNISLTLPLPSSFQRHEREIISEGQKTHVNMHLGKRRCKPDCRLHKGQSQLQLKECLAVVKSSSFIRKPAEQIAYRGCAISDLGDFEEQVRPRSVRSTSVITDHALGYREGLHSCSRSPLAPSSITARRVSISHKKGLAQLPCLLFFHISW